MRHANKILALLCLAWVSMAFADDTANDTSDSLAPAVIASHATYSRAAIAHDARTTAPLVSEQVYPLVGNIVRHEGNDCSALVRNRHETASYDVSLRLTAHTQDNREVVNKFEQATISPNSLAKIPFSCEGELDITLKVESGRKVTESSSASVNKEDNS